MVWPLAGETAHEPEPGLDQQPAISSQQHALNDSSFCYDISSSSSFSSDSNRPSNRPSCSIVVVEMTIMLLTTYLHLMTILFYSGTLIFNDKRSMILYVRLVSFRQPKMLCCND